MQRAICLSVLKDSPGSYAGSSRSDKRRIGRMSLTRPNGSLRCQATFGGRNRSTEQARGLICGPFHGIRRETLGTDFGNEEEKLPRSEEHTSELQSRLHLVCRLLLEKKKQNKY